MTICLSKGLGAPIGAVLVGSAEFTTRARHIRKAMGGGMRQAGLLAAAAEYALEHNLPRMGEDHAKARALAKGAILVHIFAIYFIVSRSRFSHPGFWLFCLFLAFSSPGGDVFRPDYDPVASTNILIVYIDDKEKKVKNGVINKVPFHS